MKRSTAVTAAIFAAFTTLAAHRASATIVVPVDQPTIQAAISAAIPGEDIIVQAGTYPEGEIDVTKSVRLYGPNVGVVPSQIRGAEARVVGGFKLSSSDVTIQGFEIDGGAIQGSFSRGVSAPTAVNGVDISYNWFHNPAGSFTTAIEMGEFNGARSQNWVVGSNKIDGQIPGLSVGIYLQAADNVSVVGNVIVLSTDANDYGFPAIVLDGVHGALIAKNDLELGQNTANPFSSAYAIGLQAVADDIVNVQVSNNRITNSVAGVLSTSAQYSVLNLAITRNDIDATYLAISLQNANLGTTPTPPLSHDRVSVTLNKLVGGVACFTVAANASRTVSNVVLRRNCFSPRAGSSGVYGVHVASSTVIPTNLGSIDARMNFWDHLSGPGAIGPGSGLLVSSRVDFSKWLETCPR
jgi:hypothetical protein